MVLIEYKGKAPTIDEEAYVSPNATLIGDVQVKKNAVIWPGSILRAEFSSIVIGEYTTVFDGVIMFTRSEKYPINTGNYTIIETGATIFGCYCEDYIVISKNALIHEGVSIGEGAIILDNSIIPPGLVISARSILKGDPAQKIREQTRNDMLKNKERADHISNLFIKIKHQLPNAQPYMMSFNDFMKILVENININNKKDGEN
ncbi:MAG: gamma carbonic anhydrase family protein [Promethearchaeota archaeon]